METGGFNMSIRMNIRLVMGVGALSGLSMTTPASASIFPGLVIQSANITNQYSYTFDESQPPPPTTGGEQATIALSDQRPIPTSQLGVDYIGQAATDSFYFLHNNYCVGRCQIASSTTIRFEIFNGSGEDIEALRFDSLITPGHLALVGLGSYENTAASFAFSVNRTDVPDGESFPFTTNLYTANGYADIFGLHVEADGVSDPFRNTISGFNDGAGRYYDWSATPLQVDVGFIADRQTIYLDYTATYSVKSFNTCVDILNCNAAQVVFGDPRNDGGGTDLASMSMARAAFDDMAIMDLAADPLIDGGVHAVINRDYQGSYIPYTFVFGDPDAPFSFPVPEPEAPRSYIGNYVPTLVDTDTTSGVPEPTTWATMVLGFALIGGMARQRRTRILCRN